MFKKFLFALALILSGTATVLTAGGMVTLFSGLWFLFITIDIARFFVTDYLIKSWKYIGVIKYFTTSILLALLMLSSVGVYNSLDQRIPKDMHESIMQTASHNRKNISSQTNQDIQKTSYEIALTEYNSRVESYDIQKNACLEREDSDKEQCIRTYNANILNAKKRLESAQSAYTKSISDTSDIIQEEVKNKTEIAGILTTICSITGGNCDTTDGLLRALRIIILLIIIALEIFAINILFIIHSDKHKDEPLRKIEWFKFKRKKKVKPVKEDIIEELPIRESEEVKIEEPEPYIGELDEPIYEEPKDQEEIISELESSIDPKNKKKILNFEEVINILKENPHILEMDKIKEVLKSNPSLRRQIKKKLQD